MIPSPVVRRLDRIAARLDQLVEPRTRLIRRIAGLERQVRYQSGEIRALHTVIRVGDEARALSDSDDSNRA